MRFKQHTKWKLKVRIWLITYHTVSILLGLIMSSLYSNKWPLVIWFSDRCAAHCIVVALIPNRWHGLTTLLGHHDVRIGWTTCVISIATNLLKMIGLLRLMSSQWDYCWNKFTCKYNPRCRCRVAAVPSSHAISVAAIGATFVHQCC